MNFLEFIQLRENNKRSSNNINESFKISDTDKAHDLMLSIFRKKISNRVFKWDWLDTTVDGQQMRSFYFIDLGNADAPKVWALNYLVESEIAEVYSISFFDINASSEFLWGNSTNIKSNLTINTLGTSVAYFIPIICHIVKNGDYGISKAAAKEIGTEVFDKGKKNESVIYDFGNLKYRIYENYTKADNDYMFYSKNGYVLTDFVNETTQAQEYRWKKKQERDDAYRKWQSNKTSVNKEILSRLQAEYQDIVNAIKGGAKTIDDIKMSLSKNVSVSIPKSESEKQVQDEIEEKRKDPEQAFKEMQVYVNTVIKGLQPGVILCGAPGIGKTYRVLQQLKANHYVDGHGLEIIKGKCTPRQLYLSLYKFKEKGNIVLIDDADALVGPKAPEDCINMLKAALDSTSSDEGRKVSYRVSGKILDDDGDEIPKIMYYNGGVIVITNYSVGQLDTALRGRTFIQSLDFSTEQVLGIIERLMPEIDKQKLTMKAKQKAIAYLRELNEQGANMEISIRTFSTCAKLFTICEDDPEMSDDDVKSMIKEQMENQSLRGGKKF